MKPIEEKPTRNAREKENRRSAGLFPQARPSVKLPGSEHEVVQAGADGAHEECSCCKATRGNINLVTTFATKSAPQEA